MEAEADEEARELGEEATEELADEKDEEDEDDGGEEKVDEGDELERELTSPNCREKTNFSGRRADPVRGGRSAS